MLYILWPIPYTFPLVLLPSLGSSPLFCSDLAGAFDQIARLDLARLMFQKACVGNLLASFRAF